MQGYSRNVQTMALLGSYVPRRCGIATFTKDLRDALAANGDKTRTLVLAMDDVPGGYPYPDEVRFQIQANRVQDYATAADLLNINQIDVAIVQHEFGIYGGPAGAHLLAFMRRLRMPIITTLHTLLTDPNEEQAAVMSEIISASDRLAVMSQGAMDILRSVYSVPAAMIAVIPHGIPDVPFVDPTFYKDQFGLEGRRVLLTFGLISPGKGIETAISALPEIVKDHPEVVYVILGATHPNIVKREGQAYLASLERLAEKLGVRENVVFHNRYVTLEELCGYLGACDVYVMPYLGKSQIVSGTLAYAMGTGKAVVSTPFAYAQEMLADGRGGLFPFGDAGALARQVKEFLGDRIAANAIRKKAYMYCRPMVWKEVGYRYIQLAGEILLDRAEAPRPALRQRPPMPQVGTLQDINVSHLLTLTDETGLMQHATYAVPDRTHGYCTDDNARALVAAIMYADLTNDDSLSRATNTYMSFLHHAFDPATRRFRNFMTYNRHWVSEPGAEDVHGRAMWALGQVVALAPNDAILSFSSRLFFSGLEMLESFTSPRAWAFALVGIHSYLERFSGDAYARRIRASLASRLYDLFRRNVGDDWPWCEDTTTYDNAKLPHALILSGKWLQDDAMLAQGLTSLEWLVRLQVSDSGVVSLIGNQGWMSRSGGRARFDQQPVEALALVQACAEAFRCTQERVWAERARICLGWFLGSNDTESVLCDYATGGCRDGLHADGPNLNEGAESTLAWLLSLLTIHQLDIDTGTLASTSASGVLETPRDAVAP